MRTIIITDDEWAFTGCDFYFEISIFFSNLNSCYKWNIYLSLNNMYLDSAW